MKTMLSRHRAVGLAACVCALTVAVPMAVAQSPDPAGRAAGGPDLRSPDTRDAALATQPAVVAVDLRAPDTQDAALATQPAVVAVDLRAPDTQDAARGVTTASQSVPAPAPASAPTVITVEQQGSQTLAIVFSASALLIALLAVGFVAVFRRPRQRWTAP
jgi:hypothetical protein